MDCRAGDVARRAGAPAGHAQVANCSALQKQRRASDPFGGFSATVRGPAMPRVFASPGTIYEPEGAARDYWRTARVLHAAGFRRGDLLHNSFSYHMTPGRRDHGKRRTRWAAPCSPAAPARPSSSWKAMADLQPDGYVGTPSFLKNPAGEGRRE